MEQMLYPDGRYESDDEGNKTYYDPTNPSANDQRGASMQASLAEDAQLRNQLGSSRKKGKNENIPSGSYALSWYPGQQSDIDMAPGRVLPADAMVRMSPEQRKAWEQKMLEWQNMQRSMVPQHGSGFISNLIGGR